MDEPKDTCPDSWFRPHLGGTGDNLVHNNLGGWKDGDDSPQDMRWEKVGSVDGVDIDLVVSVVDRPEGNAEFTAYTNWSYQKTGSIQLEPQYEHDIKSANFRFTFVETGTYNPVTIENFFWSFFTVAYLDVWNPFTMHSVITPLPSADSSDGLEYYALFDKETGKMVKTPAGEARDSPSMEVIPNEDGTLSFKGKEKLYGAISDPMNLYYDEFKQETVTLFYKNTASFDIQLATEVTGPEGEVWDASSPAEFNNRFWFAGTSQVVEELCAQLAAPDAATDPVLI
jgi:hypothetical protein